MTNSPIEPPQGNSPEQEVGVPRSADDRRRPGGSPLDFDEWVALLVAFGVLGSIFFWSLRPRANEGGWLAGLGGDNAGLLQGDGAVNPLGGGAAGLLGGSAEGEADGPDFLAQAPEEGIVIVGDDDEIDALRDGAAVDLRRPGVGIAGAAAGAAGAAAVGGAVVEEEPAVAEELADEGEAAVVEEDAALDEAAVPAEEAPAEETPAAETPTEEPIAVATESPETSIPEVPQDSWLYPFAISLQEADRLGELPTETFDIDGPITRAEFAALVSQAEQAEGTAAEAAEKFADVGEDFWASPRIAGVLQTDFMRGYPAEGGQSEVFRPAAEIPRYETLVAIATGLNLTLPEEAEIETILSQYDTTGMPDWARPKVAAALREGLVVNPDDPATLDPARSTTRGEATAMIQQTLQREGQVEPVEAPEVILQPQR